MTTSNMNVLFVLDRGLNVLSDIPISALFKALPRNVNQLILVEFGSVNDDSFDHFGIEIPLRDFTLIK
jgi:hypothetical protein